MLARDEILQQALSLPLADQLFILDALEQSLADLPPPEGEGRWVSEVEFIAELDRRSADLRSGKTKAIPVEEVMAEMWKRNAKEKTA